MLVYGREKDVPLVKEAIEAAKGKFKQVFNSEAPEITLSTDSYLPPAANGSKDEGSSSGASPPTSLSFSLECGCCAGVGHGWEIGLIYDPF